MRGGHGHRLFLKRRAGWPDRRRLGVWAKAGIWLAFSASAGGAGAPFRHAPAQPSAAEDPRPGRQPDRRLRPAAGARDFRRSCRRRCAAKGIDARGRQRRRLRRHQRRRPGAAGLGAGRRSPTWRSSSSAPTTGCAASIPPRPRRISTPSWQSSTERGVAVLLTGMKAPPNLGREYGEAFDAIYPALAAKHGVRLLSLLPRGRGGRPAAQPARRHPPERGRRRSSSGNSSLCGSCSKSSSQRSA